VLKSESAEGEGGRPTGALLQNQSVEMAKEVVPPVDLNSDDAKVPEYLWDDRIAKIRAKQFGRELYSETTRQGEESVEGHYASILESESRGVVLGLVGGNGIEARPVLLAMGQRGHEGPSRRDGTQIHGKASVWEGSPEGES
jgi:hypothetical protein